MKQNNNKDNIKEIVIKEATLSEVIKVNKNVIEFDEIIPTEEYFKNRYKDSEKLIIVAYYEDKPAGYIIGYDEFKDNKENFYCWLAGVDYKYRRKGILTKLMDYQMKWAREKGYKKLRIKSRNDKREMLSFLVKNGFDFISVEKKENIKSNNIHLVKDL